MAASFFKRSLLLRARLPALVTAGAIALAGCVSPIAGPEGRYAEPIGDAPVTANATPYSEALVCLGEYARANHRVSPRIAVGRISDYTGKEEADGSGRKLTQGASLMAISALAKSGANLVERFDTSVSELELKYANNKLISDDKNPNDGDFRKIMAGSIPGSDYYIVGGITELNFNIRSENASANGGATATNGTTGTLGGSVYVMNVGLDMRLVNTSTLEVADVISYQKQIIGHQISAGVFDFMGTNFFDVSGGESALEPIQLAVRSVIERAVLEMVTRIYRAPGASCASPINTGRDPLGDGYPYPGNQQTAYRPNPYYMESNDDYSRNSPYRSYNPAPNGDSILRGIL